MGLESCSSALNGGRWDNKVTMTCIPFTERIPIHQGEYVLLFFKSQTNALKIILVNQTHNSLC